MLGSVSPCPIEVFLELMCVCVCEGWGGDEKQSGPLPRDNCLHHLAGTTGDALENL